MGLFNRNKVAFEATQQISDYLKFNENTKEFMFKGCKAIIAADDITDYELKYGAKTYNKKNLGTAIAAGALFGVGGILLTGSHQEEYVSNISIAIKTKSNGNILIPLTIGKMKMDRAKGIIQMAEKMIALLDAQTN